MDTWPISFWYQKKGFLEIKNALIKLGQRHTASVAINVKHLLPPASTVRDTIVEMDVNDQEDMKNKGVEQI